jgi:hypothetical protein
MVMLHRCKEKAAGAEYAVKKVAKSSLTDKQVSTQLLPSKHEENPHVGTCTWKQ